MKSFTQGIDRGFETFQVFAAMFDNFLFIVGYLLACFGSRDYGNIKLLTKR